MFKYNLTSFPNFDVNTTTLDNISRIVSKLPIKEQKGILNIVFLDPLSIQKLNKKYRKVDKTTDVLSFHYFDDFSLLNKEDIAGEIILSEEKIITQAKEYGLGEEKEFYKLIIHSTIHILGYNHELDNEYRIMQDLEDKIRQELFEK